jgi:MFS transporter, DHA2 family, multidrug resistance protein
MSDAAQALPLEQAPWVPRFNPWLIGVAVALAAFMEILDTSIANVALPYIGGGLGVSNDDSTWVLTSYLVSNAIVLPISGWLAVTFGRKRFFMVCLALFTVSSILCGMATSFGLLLLFRALQGMGGGGLQPMAQAILADTFPPEKRGLAFALYGITAVVAPTVGPTLGGWITFNYSWRWIFLINFPVGLLTLFLVYRLVDDPPYLGRLKSAGVKLDYIGIAFLALGVGALQVILDRGQEDDWFGSHIITTLAIVSAVCLVSLVFWEWFNKHPIIEVRLFKNFNYLSSNVMMFTFGVLLFSSLVMMPLFLQTLLGYTAELAGLVLSGGSIVVLIAMPVVGQLTTKVQVRYIIAFGWLCLAIGMFYSTQRLDLAISFGSASWLRVIQVVGIGFLFVPITMAAYIGMPGEKSNAVAGMINFMRNMGSSVGTSVVTTLIDRRSEYHQSVLSGHTASGIQNFENLLDSARQLYIRSGMSPPDALHRAYASIYQQLQIQAANLAYIDTFKVLSVISAIMFVLSFVLRKNDPGGGGSVAVG